MERSDGPIVTMADMAENRRFTVPRRQVLGRPPHVRKADKPQLPTRQSFVKAHHPRIAIVLLPLSVAR